MKEARSFCPWAYAWLVGWPAKEAHAVDSAERRRFVEVLRRIEPSIEIAARLARHFLGLIHRRDVSGFDRWLRRASSCPVPEMRRFAASLRADLSAVRRLRLALEQRPG